MTINQKLNEYIKLHSYVSYDSIVKYSNEIGCKVDTATRHLRPSDSPNVVSVKNEKGAITGYKWRDSEEDERVRKWLSQFNKPVVENKQKQLILALTGGNNKNMNKEFSKKAVRHGEVSLLPISNVPENAKLVGEVNSFIVGHSESGHNHVLTLPDVKFKVFEFEGKTYLDIPLEAKLAHQKAGVETHGVQVIMPGIYERLIKKSYSYAEKIMRRVQD